MSTFFKEIFALRSKVLLLGNARSVIASASILFNRYNVEIHKEHFITKDVTKEIEYFKCIKAGICKIGGRGKVTSNEINARIIKMLEQAIEQDGMFNIFAQAGKKNPEISLLSDEYMEQIRRMKHKNIAAEMLRKLLDDNIKIYPDFTKTSILGGFMQFLPYDRPSCWDKNSDRVIPVTRRKLSHAVE